MKNFKTYILLFLVLCCFIAGKVYSSGEVSIFMRSPLKVESGETYRVDITINKEGISGFSKFETHLPEGFLIEPVNGNNSTFIFKNSVAKFIWIEMPRGQNLHISYNVKVPQNYTGKNKITGAFYYVHDNTKLFQEFNTLLDICTKNNDAGTNKSHYTETYLHKTNKDIYFSVQIAAFSKMVSVSDLSGIYHPADSIKMSRSGSLYKYYTGTFTTLQEALDFKKSCGVKDAFVVAYYNDRRISIREAVQILLSQEKD